MSDFLIYHICVVYAPLMTLIERTEIKIWQTLTGRIWSQIEYVLVLVAIVIPCMPKDRTIKLILFVANQDYTHAECMQCVKN